MLSCERTRPVWAPAAEFPALEQSAETLHSPLPVHKGHFKGLQQNALCSAKQALTVTSESTDYVTCTFAGSFTQCAASA